MGHNGAQEEKQQCKAGLQPARIEYPAASVV